MTAPTRWTLREPNDADAQIHARLLRGEGPEKIAESIGVAEGYVHQVIRDVESRGKKKSEPPARVLPVGEPPESRDQVDCIVAGAKIGARACIDRQSLTHCFCPRATFAINAVSPIVMPGTKLFEAMTRIRAVVVSLRGTPADERYLGDAAIVRAGRKVEPVPLIAGELPAPPPTPAQRLERERAARTMPSRPLPPAPRPSPVATVARDIPEGEEEEETMDCPVVQDDGEVCGFELAPNNKSGKCGWHASGRKSPRPIVPSPAPKGQKGWHQKTAAAKESAQPFAAASAPGPKINVNFAGADALSKNVATEIAAAVRSAAAEVGRAPTSPESSEAELQESRARFPVPFIPSAPSPRFLAAIDLLRAFHLAQAEKYAGALSLLETA